MESIGKNSQLTKARKRPPITKPLERN